MRGKHIHPPEGIEGGGRTGGCGCPGPLLQSSASVSSTPTAHPASLPGEKDQAKAPLTCTDEGVYVAAVVAVAAVKMEEGPRTAVAAVVVAAAVPVVEEEEEGVGASYLCQT